MYHPSLLLKRTLFLKTQLSEANFLPSDHSKRFTHNTRPSGKNGVSAPLRPLSLRRFPLFARGPANAQFAARSPAALSRSRRGSELRLNANGESKSVWGGGESGGG